MPGRPQVQPALRKAIAALALVLVAIVATGAWRAAGETFGVDFYHLWGIPAARDALGSNPYVDRQRYGDHLNGLAQGSPSRALQRANQARRVIDPTGTPFFYASFAALPRDFEAAIAAFTLAQYAAFVAAAALLALTHGASAALALSLGAAAALVFGPLAQDVKSGNVNSLQLLATAGLVWLSLARARLARAAFRDGFPALLAAFALFKPNTAWIVALLAAHFVAVMGWRSVPRAAAIATLAAAACAGAGAVYFDGLAVWLDWAGYASGMNGGRLVYSIAEGNQSVVEFIAEVFPRMGLLQAQLLVTTLVAGPFLLAGMAARRGDSRRHAFALLEDARFAAACGAVLTLAASPLVWPHYQVFAMLPLAWLLAGHAGRLGAALAVLACLALASPVIEPLYARQFVMARLMVLLAWVPLAAGMWVSALRAK